MLALLLERAGDVVTREELRQKLWPSSVFVDFDHGLNNAIARVREALGDPATTPRFIETLPRLGYRFICPVVTIPPPDEDTPAEATVRASSAARRISPRVIIVAAILIALVTGILVSQWLARPRLDSAPARAGLTKEPSIAVLPFVNVSPDVENEYFADGLSDELLGKLAGIRGLRVAGQTSSFYFKGKREQPSVIAQALKVNYLLEGSVRRDGGRVRVTAQLIDGASGYHLWTQQFDRDFSDIFQIQEDIALAVAAAMPVKLLAADERRLRKRGTQDAEALRLYLMGLALLKGISVRQDLQAAKELFDRAIARDPDFAAAHAGLAHYYFTRAWARLVDVEEGAQLGRAAAARAEALDPESSEALQAHANFEMWRYRITGKFDAYLAAQKAYRRAIELDPWDHYIFFDYGRAMLWHEPDLAQSLFERAGELDPLARIAQGASAVALSLRGSHDLARKRVQALSHQPPDRRLALVAAGLEQELGRLDEAAVLLRGALPADYVGTSIQLWGLYMSLGDTVAAQEVLQNASGSPLSKVLAGAARLTMHGRYTDAFEYLDRRRPDFPTSHVLDVPLARIALIADKPERARAILEERLPDLLAGVAPVCPSNLMPALDLAAAWNATGRSTQARNLLARVAAFLDGPAAPQWPLFIFQRARTHALAGEPALANDALDRAYAAAFRMTWAPDLIPQPLLYIDTIAVDPALATLRTTARYQSWLERTQADNARQLAQLKKRALSGG